MEEQKGTVSMGDITLGVGLDSSDLDQAVNRLLDRIEGAVQAARKAWNEDKEKK